MNNYPNILLQTLGEPYSNYNELITDTLNYKYYTPLIMDSKSKFWNISHESISYSIIRITYASLLELFIEDNTPEMFYFVFKDYLKEVFSHTDNILYRDGDFNSIFHYDAIHGKSRIEQYSKISKLYNEDARKEVGIDTEIFSIDILKDKNNSNVSVLDVIRKNK